MKAKPVPVYAKDRKTLLGHVSAQSTSIGASKLAGAPCLMSRVNGYRAWVAKEERA